MKQKNRRGFTITAAILIVLVIGILAMAASVYVASDSVLSARNYYGLKAFYIADAGNDYYFKQLTADPNWSTPPTQETKAFAGGYLVITTNNALTNSITYTSTGIITLEGKTYTRAIRASVSRGGGGLQDIANTYGIFISSGAKTHGVGSNFDGVTIEGSVWIAGELSITETAYINGDAHASSDIWDDDKTYSNITGTREEYAAIPPNAPVLDTTYYDGEIAYAAAHPDSPGARDFNGSLPPGKYNVENTVTIDGDLTTTGVATIATSGNLIVNSGVTIGDNFTFIAGGDIIIYGGSSNSNRTKIGKNNLWFSSTNFQSVGNYVIIGSSESGGGTVFLAPGNVNFAEDDDFYGFIHCGKAMIGGSYVNFTGLLVCNNFSNFGPNSTITLKGDSVNYNSIPGETATGGSGPPGITNWGETF